MQKKILMLALLLMLEAGLGPAVLEARRAYDPAVATTVEVQQPGGRQQGIETRRKKQKEKQQEQADEAKKPTLAERIDAILHPPAPEPARPSTANFSDAIEGFAIASPRQCVEYLLDNNPNPAISVSPQQLVEYYYAEGGREGIRPDLAFAQALKETGYFRYGGTVTPDQNNYCGLGTTSTTVQGGYFATAELGVRAQIQHLMAYCTTRQPQTMIVDPRYWLVRERYGDEVLTTWPELDGRWAVPGYDYGESILFILSQILLEP